MFENPIHESVKIFKLDTHQSRAWQALLGVLTGAKEDPCVNNLSVINQTNLGQSSVPMHNCSVDYVIEQLIPSPKNFKSPFHILMCNAFQEVQNT